MGAYLGKGTYWQLIASCWLYLIRRVYTKAQFPSTTETTLQSHSIMVSHTFPYFMIVLLSILGLQTYSFTKYQYCKYLGVTSNSIWRARTVILETDEIESITQYSCRSTSNIRSYLVAQYYKEQNCNKGLHGKGGS